jgi:hypothetical protein
MGRVLYYNTVSVAKNIDPLISRSRLFFIKNDFKVLSSEMDPAESKLIR